MSSTAPLRRSSLPRLPGRLPGRLGAAADEAIGRARLAAVPRLRSRAPKVPFVTLVSVLLLGGVIGLLLFNTSMQQASFQASQLQQQADTLTAEQQALQARMDALDNPQQIARRADAMHMVIAPAGTATVHIGGAGGSRVTGTTPPATRLDALSIKPPPIRPPAQVVVHSPPPPPAAPPSDPVKLGPQHGAAPGRTTKTTQTGSHPHH